MQRRRRACWTCRPSLPARASGPIDRLAARPRPRRVEQEELDAVRQRAADEGAAGRAEADGEGGARTDPASAEGRRSTQTPLVRSRQRWRLDRHTRLRRDGGARRRCASSSRLGYGTRSGSARGRQPGGRWRHAACPPGRAVSRRDEHHEHLGARPPAARSRRAGTLAEADPGEVSSASGLAHAAGGAPRDTV